MTDEEGDVEVNDVLKAVGTADDEDAKSDDVEENPKSKKSQEIKMEEQIINTMNEMREDASSMGINPDSYASLNFLRNLDLNYNAKKKKLGPNRTDETK